MKRIICNALVAATAAFYLGSIAQASQPVTIAISPVGDPGNAADPTQQGDGTSGYGIVGYTFNIGTYDVTLTQYTAFLNAVAATDTYGLYNVALSLVSSVKGISRSGASGSYSYSVIGDGQRPVTYVSWFDAARFTNWLQNGQPTGVEGAGTTETGAYTLNGDTTNGMTETRNAGAQWWLPNEEEQYKAAYYDPSLNGGLGGYWAYATRSNSAPGNSWANRTLTNEANYYSAGYTLSGGTGGYLTPVGAFTNSASAYGTYDQDGNVAQWNDSIVYSGRGCRGGSYYTDATALASSGRNYNDPTFEGAQIGFRVATSIPEPSSIMLVGLGGTGLALLRRKRLKG